MRGTAVTQFYGNPKTDQLRQQIYSNREYSLRDIEKENIDNNKNVRLYHLQRQNTTITKFGT